MYKHIMFGNIFNFESKNGITQMFVDGVFVNSVRSSNQIEKDIGILMIGYNE